MTIIIRKCSYDIFWYKNHIGEEYEVIDKKGSMYEVHKAHGYVKPKFILKTDCESIAGEFNGKLINHNLDERIDFRDAARGFEVAMPLSDYLLKYYKDDEK